jgi:tetratricopeptide (TPR) repeat protein
MRFLSEPGRFLGVLQAVLEIEAFVFLLHGFGLPAFWRVFLPLGAHLLAVSLVSVGLVRRWDFSKGRERAWAVVGLCMMLPLPLLGFLGFVMIYALVESSSKRGGELLKDFQEYISYDPAVIQGAVRSDEDGDRFLMAEVNVSPLREILAGDDIPLKRGAILSLSRLPRADAVALLKRALADETREIRYYASTALSDMEKEFNDRIFRLVREVERNPTTAERHVDLARIVLDYADAGLLDEGMVRYFLEIGLRALDKAKLIQDRPPQVELFEGLLLRRLGHLEKADASLQRYAAVRRDDPEVMVILAEVAYERKDMLRARSLVAEAMGRFPEDHRFEELAAVLGGA